MCPCCDRTVDLGRIAEHVRSKQHKRWLTYLEEQYELEAKQTSGALPDWIEIRNGQEYCHPCWKFVDNKHLESTGHCLRVQRHRRHHLQSNGSCLALMDAEASSTDNAGEPSSGSQSPWANPPAVAPTVIAGEPSSSSQSPWANRPVVASTVIAGEASASSQLPWANRPAVQPVRCITALPESLVSPPSPVWTVWIYLARSRVFVNKFDNEELGVLQSGTASE